MKLNHLCLGAIISVATAIGADAQTADNLASAQGQGECLHNSSTAPWGIKPTGALAAATPEIPSKYGFGHYRITVPQLVASGRFEDFVTICGKLPAGAHFTDRSKPSAGKTFSFAFGANIYQPASSAILPSPVQSSVSVGNDTMKGIVQSYPIHERDTILHINFVDWYNGNLQRPDPNCQSLTFAMNDNDGAAELEVKVCLDQSTGSTR